VDITHTGQEETIDGVRIVFHLTPGTEAPAEMNFLFPQRRALCMAENATHTMHNLLTLRGAVVRDPLVWARYLDEALTLFADEADVAFASHHWPVWGREAIVRELTVQRDLYAYLHDQTLRLLNDGLTGMEIAEQLTLPPELETVWADRGYYGSLSHNVKAIYQRYLGWFDGNPAHLWEHPPVEEARRYVDVLGGIDATIAAGKRYADAGDLRFAATLLNHAVFADPSHDTAKQALATVYEKLGQGAENGTWRNFYLAGASELRHGIRTRMVDTSNPEMTMALTVDQLIDSLAIRVDGPKAWDVTLTMDWHLTDEDRVYRLMLSHGALIPRSTSADKPFTEPAEAKLTLTKPQLLGVLGGGGLSGVRVDGDANVFTKLVGLLDTPDPAFPIVTP
jgi:alkyl sulfatase BDS1-like metallo-beta-lactamase superfamily hydrolase